MRTQEVLDLEDLCLDEGPDMIAAMTSPELRRYVDDDDADDDDIGLRTLLEKPEALCRTFRRRMH
jgi:hypothetical protein